MSPASLALLDHPPETEADLDIDGDLVARRIESEAQAVQIMTIWKAKGLQFPVVCLPMLWRPEEAERGRSTPIRTPAADDGPRQGNGLARQPAAGERKQQARDEEASEELRLLYVALTRAQHHTAVWWANSPRECEPGPSVVSCSPATRRPVVLDPERFRTGPVHRPGEDEAVDALAALAARAPGRSP